MKYYKKDYENFVTDQEAETRVEKQRQDDEEIRHIEKTRRPFKSLIDVYRDRHNGYPSTTILFLSIFASTIILLVILIAIMIIGNILIYLNIIPNIDLFRIIFLRLWALLPIAIIFITVLLLNKRVFQ